MMARGILSVAVSIINEASLIRRRLSEYSRSTATLKSWKISFLFLKNLKMARKCRDCPEKETANIDLEKVEVQEEKRFSFPKL